MYILKIKLSSGYLVMGVSLSFFLARSAVSVLGSSNLYKLCDVTVVGHGGKLNSR